MRVCIFSGVISLDRDNIDVRKNYLLERVKYFGDKDFDLEIMSPSAKKMDYLDYDNLYYTHYQYLPKKGIKMISALLFSFPKLVKVDCDIVHCFNYQALFVAHIANIFRARKYITVFEAMGLADAESTTSTNASLKVRILRPYIRYFETYAFKKSKGVIVYTSIIKDYVINHFGIDGNKICVVPHGVDVDFCNNEVEIPNFQRELSKYGAIAMYVGSLSRLHGTPHLMSVIDELNAKRPDVLFLILGTGPFKEELESFIERKQLDNVILVGYVPSEIIPFYLKKADVLLIPHSKCLQTELDPPTKLFEYLKAGKPIVSFDFKAVKEVVGDKAILVEPENIVSFADGIIKVLDNKVYYLERAKEAVSIVASYSWEASAEELFKAYLYFSSFDSG
ncbi:glycosyltransferase [Methanolobus profundi]|uniref:Glycosyltransferase involved in cell wall bisynthesis n=1 Tax=Methanolobus profundi TaxID=487685 RepID=A0A1I4RX24_9EURY|nr:glycosyltransferase [Methanolobus profundi]SFM56767.1 Glycosyltransferase involved in cell wall bisynthesis [Methanolobus profundi]